MNAEESLHLCRLAKALSPAQAVDEYTPEAWGLVLEDVRFEDAKEALVSLAKEREWIHVSHIFQRVKAIRGRRIEVYGPVTPPRDMAYEDETQWLRETRRRIADGELVRGQGQAPLEKGGPHPSVAKAIRASFRDPNAEPTAAMRADIAAAKHVETEESAS